ARDVAPGRLAVEVSRSGDRPADRMRIARADGERRQVLRLVAARAEVLPVALPARRLVGGGVDRVPAEVIVAVDERGRDLLGELDLYPRRVGPGVAPGAVGLVVALRAGLRRAARVGAVAGHVVSLVREVGERLQRDAVQGRVAAQALDLRVLL